MSNWQSPPPAGFNPGPQAGEFAYPQQNPGYPAPGGGYGGQPYIPQGYGGPPPGFIPPGGSGYGQGPPPPPPGGVPFGGIPPGAGMYGSGYAEDPMRDEPKGFEFNDKSIRNGFIRKVYSILMLQLTITVAVIALFLYHKKTREYVQHNPAIFWVAFVMTIVLLISMACCTNVRRKAPTNFIFLFLFTGCEAIVLATAASTYNADAVLMAAGITAVICLGLTLFAFQTRFDFTGMHTILFIALIVLLLFGILAAIFPGKTMQLVYASLGALLFSFYLIYDTQMMIGGKHKYSISPEEYIFAALNLYLDVINIFMYILAIIGSSRD